MKILKKIIKWILAFLLIPIIYLIVSLLLTTITVHKKSNTSVSNQSIFLTSNGIHLDIVIPIQNIDSLLLLDLKYAATDHYLSFGWGDENFYLNTPTWGDLTLKNALSALFLKSTSLMHVTRYRQKQSYWIEIKINETELYDLNAYLQNTFAINEGGTKTILENKGYFSTDDFYKATGSYSCFNTCNSWVNAAFKESGLKSCYWTPFDFGLLNKYK